MGKLVCYCPAGQSDDEGYCKVEPICDDGGLLSITAPATRLSRLTRADDAAVSFIVFSEQPDRRGARTGVDNLAPAAAIAVARAVADVPSAPVTDELVGRVSAHLRSQTTFHTRDDDLHRRWTRFSMPKEDFDALVEAVRETGPSDE